MVATPSMIQADRDLQDALVEAAAGVRCPLPDFLQRLMALKEPSLVELLDG